MLEARPAVKTMKAYRSPSAGLTGLNMNMNENTAGCSPRVFRKLAGLTAEEISRYPHRDHDEEVVARFLGLGKEQIVLTNGVDEGIHLICEAYLREEDEAILVVPTFGMYAIYIQATGAKIVTIAQFTHTSIGPNSFSTRSATRSTSSAWATSQGRGSARPPACSTCFFALSSRSLFREINPMLAPCLANSFTTARPTPAPAPVTTTTSP